MTAGAPLATYRLQLGPHLTFEDAAALVPYLDALGITDCYTSPFFETASDGSHGYDIADHNRLRAELGGEPGFARLAEALKRHAMGLLVDVVPNHMGIAGTRNAWWWDVLEHGEASRYAPFFDIDWHPVKLELAGKVLLPILGQPYGEALDAGELSLAYEDGRFTIRYYAARLPVTPRSYGKILGTRLDAVQAALGLDDPALVELKSLISWFVTLPPGHGLDDARARLARLVDSAPPIRDHVADVVSAYNGRPGDPRSHDLLDALLAEQAYRVAFWRVAGDEINYRRFFDINELAAIHMEDPAVFTATHRLLFRLVGDGVVTGLRVDHPDGLYAPAEYFRRLQRGCAQARGLDPATPGASFYIVTEKILAGDESLPETWPVAGTTGYDFLNRLNGLFVDRGHARAMAELYGRLVHEHPSFAEIVYRAKRLIMETSMASEVNVLAHRLNGISEKHRSSRDFTLTVLGAALREIVASFPVYRTYFGENEGEARSRDCAVVAFAVAHAKPRTPTINVSIYDWIADILTLAMPGWADEAARQERVDFAMRFQQLTGPVTAKGYEDTALYRYLRLVALNEVGGAPDRFGLTLDEFHHFNAERQARTPDALSATSTHDTKRGEDVRARIDVLSELPREWRLRVHRWQRLNRKHRTDVDGHPVPGPNEEYLIYQTLVGAWPISAERLSQYAAKAVHEAKVHTSWINPNAAYDAAIAAFVERILDPRRSRLFLRDFEPFQTRIAHFGALTSLAQTLLKIAAPGVPDFYQGTELWDLNLVDPDNRRPVDFESRRTMLDDLETRLRDHDRPALARALLEAKADGCAKMFLIHEALGHRRAHAGLYRRGDYRPLAARGAGAEHVCAFARVRGGESVVAVAPRFLARRGREGVPLGAAYWGDTEVAVPAAVGERFTNVLTGETVSARGDGDDRSLALADVLANFSVALLAGAPR